MQLAIKIENYIVSTHFEKVIMCNRYAYSLNWKLFGFKLKSISIGFGPKINCANQFSYSIHSVLMIQLIDASFNDMKFEFFKITFYSSIIIKQINIFLQNLPYYT